MGQETEELTCPLQKHGHDTSHGPLTSPDVGGRALSPCSSPTVCFMLFVTWAYGSLCASAPLREEWPCLGTVALETSGGAVELPRLSGVIRMICSPYRMMFRND
jgi:hypothetical protein